MAPEGRSPRRRQVLGAVLAVGIVAAALLVVLTAGAVRPPELPSLAATPEPGIPGRVIFTTAGEDDRTCVALVDAGGGQPQTLHCVDGLWPVDLTWTEPGEVVLRGHDELGQLEITIAPDDGRPLRRRRLRPDERPPHDDPHPRIDERGDGGYLLTGWPGGDSQEATVVLVEPDGAERTLVRVDGGHRYGFVDARFSPDGRWVLVADSAERLLVVPAAGGQPRVLATDAGEHAAWEPTS